MLHLLHVTDAQTASISSRNQGPPHEGEGMASASSICAQPASLTRSAPASHPPIIPAATQDQDGAQPHRQLRPRQEDGGLGASRQGTSCGKPLSIVQGQGRDGQGGKRSSRAASLSPVWQRPKRSTPFDMTSFHTDEYIDFLQRVSPESVDELTGKGTRCRRLLGNDCFVCCISSRS